MYCPRDRAARAEQQVAGLRRAAADHHLLRIERVDRVRDADADPLAPDLDDARRGDIAPLGGLDRVGAEHGPALCRERGQRRFRVQPGGLLGQPVERVAGGDELERARLRKARRARHRSGEVEPDDRVSELAGPARRPAVDLRRRARSPRRLRCRR